MAPAACAVALALEADTLHDESLSPVHEIEKPRGKPQEQDTPGRLIVQVLQEDEGE
mgnify:CR=1 FL=1